MGTSPTVHRLSDVTLDRSIKIIEALVQPEEGNRTLHVCHPRPTTWNALMKSVSSHLRDLGQSVELVPYEKWFATLETSDKSDPATLRKNPVLKLVDFLRAGTIRLPGKSRDALNFPMVKTEKMRKVSPTLDALPSLNDDDVKRWMDYSSKRGLFV